MPSPVCTSLGVEYVSLEDLLARLDVVSLHCPLTPETHHLMSADMLARLKPGMTLVNTSRGAVIETRAVIRGLKEGVIGALANISAFVECGCANHEISVGIIAGQPAG